MVLSTNKIGKNYVIVNFLNSSFIQIFHWLFILLISGNKPKKLQDTRVEFFHVSNGNVALRTVGKMPSEK